MRWFRSILVLLFFASHLYAQSSQDVRFVLATKDGRTTFRIGEEIDLQFRFTTQDATRYQVAPCYPLRRFVVTSPDSFEIEPKTGTVDPIADLSAQFEGGMVCGNGGLVFLTSNALVRDRILNDWVEFRQSGHFRITALTNQIVDSQSKARLRLQSNTLEIDIIDPEPGWTQNQAEQAIGVLKAGGSTNDPRLVQAAKTLRFLESAEAVPGLVEFFDKYWFAPDLKMGLISSPFRKEILAGLNADLTAPDVPITKGWLNAAVELAAVAITGPRPKDPAGEPAYMAQFKSVENRYLTELSTAVTRKQGQARVVTLQTLLLAGSQPPDESIRQAVIDSFTELPEANQVSLLTAYWLHWSSAAAHPAVLAAAKGSGSARNDALIRLLEFSKEEARQVVIDRVRNGDYAVVMGNFPRALLALPDKTLPELDEVLASDYEKQQPVERLVARYATERIYNRILAEYERHPNCGEVLAYFFRVDPERARGQHCDLQFARPVTRSPGLEQAAIEDLRSGDPRRLDYALPLLEGGSAKAKEALWAEMERRKQNDTVVNGIIYTLLKPGDWLLTFGELDEAKAACPDPSCQSSVEDARRYVKSPVIVDIGGPVRIGPFELSTREEIISALKRYPAGTTFRLQPTPRLRPWNYSEQLSEVRAAFEAAGIPLLEN